MSDLLTFLFTDLEGSTRLWEGHPETMKAAMARHDQILKDSVAAQGGRVVKTTGDGLHAVFESASAAVSSALEGQRAILAEEWPPPVGQFKVRMGLHTGESQARGGDYYGTTVNRAARVMSSAHGGQVLLSSACAGLVRETLPEGASLMDLGEHRLRDLSRPDLLYQLCHESLPDSFPPPKSLSAYKHNLPVQLTNFIGRQKELTQVREALVGNRLVTLLGPGGTGKTRLMIQAGAEVVQDYPDGVWLVELAALTDPALIAERVAAAVGAQEQPGRPMEAALGDFLRRKEALLLLDNVEHLVRESAGLAEFLLTHCPQLKILVTGREALFIGGEVTLQIPSLDLPSEAEAHEPEGLQACESVQLFLARVRSAVPDFRITMENAPAVAEIVRRLDGIPLALELAAARMRMMSAAQIAARLNDRFRLLTGGRRTAMARQQTLQALIDWSWNLLEADEKILLARLSVFSGGWTFEAAEEICGFDGLDVFFGLEGLVNKSLVAVERAEEEAVRYRLLESIRQYARDRLIDLEESQALRDRHAGYYASLAEQADEHINGREMMVWVRQLKAEKDNFRAVLDWTLEEQPELALRVTGVLRYHFAFWMAPSEAKSWLEAAVASGRPAFERGDFSENPAVFIKSLIGLVSLSGIQGDVTPALDLKEEARAIADEAGEIRLMVGATVVGGLRVIFQPTPELVSQLEDAIRISRKHGYRTELYFALGTLGYAYMLQGKTQKGATLVKEGARIAKAIGNPMGEAVTLAAQAGIARYSGDLESAKELQLEVIDHYEAVGHVAGVNTARSALAHILREQGKFEEAREVYAHSILAWQEQGQLPAVAHQLECFAYMEMADERYEKAARLLGAAAALRELLKADSYDPREVAEREQAITRLGKQMGESERDRLLSEGRSLDIDAAIALALGESEHDDS